MLRVAELAQALVFGVTTELDMFCVPDLLGPPRAAAVRRDDIADIRSAGIGATAPGGHPTNRAKSDRADARHLRELWMLSRVPQS